MSENFVNRRWFVTSDAAGAAGAVATAGAPADASDPEGTAIPAYLARPDGPAARHPGILVLQDRFGGTNVVRETTGRFAGLGAAAVAPARYHRAGGFEIPYVSAEHS